MDGQGIEKGLGVTFKRFVDTYIEDIKWLGKRYYTEKGIERRMSSDTRGVFTIQYPEEKLPVPEEFRFIPKPELAEILIKGKCRNTIHLKPGTSAFLKKRVQSCFQE